MATNRTLAFSSNSSLRSEWKALLMFGASITVILFDTAILPVALPAIQQAFNIPWVWMQWVINSYFLVMAASLIGGGRLSDLLGNRRIYCWGLFLFILGAGGCAAAPQIMYLISARILQGIGAALIWPSMMSLMVERFPIGRRGRAIGLCTAASTVFFTVGPFAGGVLTEYGSWRLLFLMTVPLALLAWGICLSICPKAQKLKESFDIASFISLFFGSIAIAIACILVKGANGHHFETRLLLGLGAVGVAATCFFHTQAPYPLIDFSIFRSRSFVGGVLIAIATQFIMVASIFWMIFLQKSLHYTPTEAGTIAICLNLPSLFLPAVSGHLFDRAGGRLPLIAGFSGILFSTLCMLWYTFNHQFICFILGLVFFGIGSALFITPASAFALQDIPEKKQGVAYATFNALRFLGSSMGVAILGSINQFIRMGQFTEIILSTPELEGIDPKTIVKSLGSTKIEHQNILDIPSKLFESLGETYVRLSCDALNGMNLVTAFVALVGIGLALLFMKQEKTCKLEF